MESRRLQAARFFDRRLAFPLLSAPLFLMVACDESRHGKLTPVVQHFEGQLRVDPCNPETARKLVDTLKRANDLKAALQVSRDYTKQCKWDDEIGQAQFALEQATGDEKAVLELARKLHESAPDDFERLDRLLGLLEKAGEKEELLTTLVVQLGLYPQDEKVLERLATTYERQGDPCRALVTWGILSVVSDELRERADTERQRLAALPACKGVLPTESAKLSHEAIRGLFVFPATIGDARVRLGVDAVAAYSYFAKEALAGISNTKPLKRRVTLRTAFGNLEGDMISVPEVALGGMKIGPFDAVVVPRLEGGQDGMLGQNVLSRLRLDQAGETEWRFRPL